MDNTRALPPQQRGGNTFTSRMMKSNLRPVVLFVAFITALWSFLWASIAISIGILYSVASIIQIFGLFAVSVRNINLVRIYAFGSILAALCILAGTLTQIVIHFLQKKTLLSVCTDNNTGDTIFYSWGIWGPVTSTTLNKADAARWCDRTWSRGAWSNIVLFFIELCLAAFFLFIIFGYYKQLLDPSSVTNTVHPQNQYPLRAYPQQPYTDGYGYNPNFPPPQGPPPGGYGQGFDQPFVPPYDNAKLPTYDGAGPKYDDTKDGEGLLKHGDDDPFGDHRNDAGRSDSGHGNARR
ncbi:hypothetical protein BDM02DRAFT_500465 [Thelephora ganbajun]|uniref:Uncharacterized protein n=1 Tax=Thelephora ganbajun TaxID=370292 RepID=A0ACB6Z8D6_THEGA|nr:hypothetical protein BDM02DRAFT_500465 [Thelephora ganbajun]